MGPDDQSREVEDRASRITPESPPAMFSSSQRIAVNRCVWMGMIVEDLSGGYVPTVVCVGLSDHHDITSDRSLLAAEFGVGEWAFDTFQLDERQVYLRVDVRTLTLEYLAVGELNLHRFIQFKSNVGIGKDGSFRVYVKA